MALGDTMPDTTANIQFFGDWRHVQEGAIERGGRLKIEYDGQRLSSCFRPWRGAEFGDITALIRFYPRGELVAGSVVAPVHDRENPPGMVVGHVSAPLEVVVPSDATQAEIWFHNFSQTTSRCDAWDSRFGDNYWFDVGGPSPRVPKQPVSLRRGAATRADVVNPLEQRSAKVNVFPLPPGGGPPAGKNLQTTLDVTAWVKDTRYGANAWIDVHVFDGADELVHAQTLTLLYVGFGPSFQYAFSGSVFQGSTATPGSVQPHPDARTVQYRLYYEAFYQAFTDGILHQLEVPSDATVR
jgi:hypothetical protein